MAQQERYSDVLHQIGSNIKHYRMRRNLSQARLAEQVGISASYLSKIERGSVNSFAIITLLDIANHLKVDAKVLLECEEGENILI